MENERELAFARAFAYLGANRIEGAVVELGVFRGESLAALARLAVGRRVVGIDSFEGLPAPGEHDSEQFARGQLRASMVDVHEALARASARDRVELVEGWFADLRSRGFCVSPAALVHLDCDLYESAAAGLRLADPADGAVVLVDDFYCHRASPVLGVRRGFSEWLQLTRRTATWFDRYSWHGAGFVVHGGEG